VAKNYRSAPQYTSVPPDAERQPLQWAEAHILESGSVRASISTAVGDRGNRLYSFILGRSKGPGHTSKFFQPRDVEDLAQVIEAVREWLEKATATEATATEHSSGGE
jgi:hypothetical protein